MMEGRIVNLLLLLFFVGIFSENGFAQNRQIHFEEKDWDAAIFKARKENKLIFLDCHTSWCGPCKNLAANIFTKDVVADFYNEHFVNIALDMEKDVDGVRLAKVYNPSAYPTLLFIDPYTELVVYKSVGGGDIDYVLRIAYQALNSGKSLAKYRQRYENGEHSPDFLRSFMNSLYLAKEWKLLREVEEVYFSSLDIQQLLSQENWELLKKYGIHSNMNVFRRILKYQNDFIQVFQLEEVASLLQWGVIAELGDAINAQNREKAIGDLMCRLEKMNFPGSLILLADVRFYYCLSRDYKEAWKAFYNFDLLDTRRIADRLFIRSFNDLRFDILVPLSNKVLLEGLLHAFDAMKAHSVFLPDLARLALGQGVLYFELFKIKEGRLAFEEYRQYFEMK